jgi:hypothetical protein
MPSEDFFRYTMTPQKIPVFLAWLGMVAPEKIEKAQKTRKMLPNPRLRSSLASNR